MNQKARCACGRQMAMPAALLFSARLYYQLDRRAFTTEDRGQHPDGRPLFCGNSSEAERFVANEEAEISTFSYRSISDPTHRKRCCGLLSRKGACKSPRVHHRALREQITNRSQNGITLVKIQYARPLWGE